MEVKQLKLIDDAFDKFKLIFASVSEKNLIRLKLSYDDEMYAEDEKKKLMEDLKEMESLKVDIGDEGKILQKDLVEFITAGVGDKDDLILRIELLFYGFKIFCRKDVKLEQNQFIIFTNDSILDFEKIELLKSELDEFELVIESVKENNEVLINLNFTLHF